MADSVPLDVSKYLPPSFFEGLADSFMQNLSNSIGKKILAIKASTGSNDKNETLSDGIKNLSKDSTAKGVLKTLLEDIGLTSKDKGKKEDKKDDKKEKVVDKKESDNKGLLSYVGQFFASNKNKDGENKTLEEDKKPALTIIDGLSPNAQKVLHKIIGESAIKRKDDKKKEEEPKKGSSIFGKMFGGLALLAGGLFALYEGLKDDGPFKGLLKLVGRVGVRGALMLFNSIGKVVTKGLKLFSDGIVSGIKSFFGFSAKEGVEVLGKAGGGGILKMFSGVKTWLGKMFAKIGLKIPGLGAIIGIGFAVSRFMKGDVVGGIIDLLSGVASCVNFVAPGLGFAISLGLDALNAFLDYKAGGTPDAGGKGKGGMIWGWIKDATKWMGEKFGDVIVALPVIGPLIRSIGEFSQGNFLKGLKQMAYIVPIFELVGALLGDEDVPATKGVQGALGSVWGMIKSLGAWASEKIGKLVLELPIIGPALKAVGEFSQGNFLKGLKQMAYIFPPFELLGALLGDEEVGAVAKAGAGVITSISGMFESMGKWMKEKIMKVPILGGLLKGIGQIYDGDVLKGLKTMGMSVPILGNIISFFSDDNEQESEQAPPPKPKGIFSKLKDMILEKARAWWKDTNLQWLARRILPDSIISALDNNQPPPEQSDEEKKALASEYAKNKAAKREKAIAERVKSGIQSPEATPVGDAMIDPKGGLIVSSQTSGKIYKLNKTDGVVAAPFTQESKPSLNLDGSKLLGDIESNTGDTNKSIVKLAEAMFKIMGIIGENSSKQGVNVYPTMTQQPQQKNDAQALQSISNAIQGIRNEFLSSIYQS
jgi:hypothetical protein